MNKGLFKIYPFLFFIFGVYQIYSGLIAAQEIRILEILSGILLLSFPVMTYQTLIPKK
jgi:hypothetical protein